MQLLNQDHIDHATQYIDAWLDTMHGPSGYGGPVAHWWQDCLQYTGAGLDWRYEGIISGYLNLYERTLLPAWLDKAKRATDVLASPGVYEIFGLVIFEDLICGTPVVVTDDCGAERLISETHADYLVSYGDETH